MSKYDNYVYITICEVSFKTFRESEYSTYNNYCKGLLRSIKENYLTKREKMDLSIIIEEMDLIFGMDENETNRYLLEYLESDRCVEFEKVVRITNDLFPFTGG